VLHHRPTLKLAAPLLAVVLALAGCGSSGAGSGSANAAAAAFPDHPLVYVSVNLDQGSSAWKSARAVLSRLPSGQKAVARLEHEMQSSSGGFATNVEPWIGSQAAFAVTGADVGNPRVPVDVAGYVGVRDEGALESALARKHVAKTGNDGDFTLYRMPGGRAFAAVGHGALLASNDRATLHHQIALLSGSAGSLADDPVFQQRMAALPDGSLVEMYADLHQVAGLLSLASMGGAGSGSDPAALAKMARALGKAGTLTGSLGADAHGFRLTLNTSGTTGKTPSGPPALISHVPADAFAYLGGDLRVPGHLALPNFPGLATDPQAARLLANLLPLLNGQVAAYAAPGDPLTAALLSQPADQAAAARAARRLARMANRSSPTPISAHRTGGLVVLSNDPHTGAVPSSGLATSPVFESAAQAAGLPSSVGFLAYVGFPQIVKALPQAGSDPDARHLGGLLVWTTRDAAGSHLVAYLQIR
jgi:Protein of unknown function (DUF3352)